MQRVASSKTEVRPQAEENVWEELEGPGASTQVHEIEETKEDS